MTIRFDRLAQIADHLEKGQLIHPVFDFRYFNTCDDDETPLPPHAPPHCGTNGCAVGEFPAIWPQDWHFDTKDPFSALPRLRHAHNKHVESDVCDWLGLDMNAYYHLFVPSSQEPGDFGGQVLYRDATKDQVAANIRAFIATMQAQDAAT